MTEQDVANTEVEAVEEPKKEAKPEYTGPRCEVCGKPISAEGSIEEGHGPLCKQRQAAGHTKESLAEYKASRTVEELEGGEELWVSIPKLAEKCREEGVPISRMVAAIGGDRGLGTPKHEDLNPVYCGRTRYVKATALTEHWNLIGTAPVRKRKAKAEAKEGSEGKVEKLAGGQEKPKKVRVR